MTYVLVLSITSIESLASLKLGQKTAQISQVFENQGRTPRDPYFSLAAWIFLIKICCFDVILSRDTVFQLNTQHTLAPHLTPRKGFVNSWEKFALVAVQDRNTSKNLEFIIFVQSQLLGGFQPFRKVELLLMCFFVLSYCVMVITTPSWSLVLSPEIGPGDRVWLALPWSQYPRRQSRAQSVHSETWEHPWEHPLPLSSAANDTRHASGTGTRLIKMTVGCLLRLLRLRQVWINLITVSDAKVSSLTTITYICPAKRLPSWELLPPEEEPP